MLKTKAPLEQQADPSVMEKIAAAAALLQNANAANPIQWLLMDPHTRAASKAVSQKRIEVAVETANAAEKSDVKTAMLLTDLSATRARSESLIEHHHKLNRVDLHGVDDLFDYLIGIHEDKRHRIDNWRAKNGDPILIERNIAAITQRTNQMMIEALKSCFGEDCLMIQEET